MPIPSTSAQGRAELLKTIGVVVLMLGIDSASAVYRTEQNSSTSQSNHHETLSARTRRHQLSYERGGTGARGERPTGQSLPKLATASSCQPIRVRADWDEHRCLETKASGPFRRAVARVLDVSIFPARDFCGLATGPAFFQRVIFFSS